MPTFADAVKRLLVGRPVRSERLPETRLPKRIALPVFASDALSSVAYAPHEIFLTLAAAGVGAYVFSWQVGLAVGLVLLVVVASYRQNVRAYPSGGGDYEVATVNLGRRAGLTVASALLMDYVLTVAVSISAAAQYAASAVPALRGHETAAAVVAVLLLMSMNLRGVRESGVLFAVPTYVFLASLALMTLWGAVRLLTGELPPAQSARFTTVVEPQFADGLVGLAGFVLLLRAFSAGAAALTGVQAISNGVPAFEEPRSRNAATTLALLGAIGVAMLMSTVLLARAMQVRYVDESRPWEALLLDGRTGVPGPAGSVVFPDGTVYHQLPIIGQLAEGIFDGFAPAFLLVTVATGLILVLAANTAFNGFPVLGSILARDGYLPRQLHTRGDRLAFSNGILMLAGAAVLLVVAFDAEVTRLIQLYIVGVFVSFTMSQAGMVRHWNRLLRTEVDASTRRRMIRSRAINAVGLSCTGLVLVIVLVTKFTHGAWITVLAMGLLYGLMRMIRRHYDQVSQELATAEEVDGARALPSRVHAIVLVSKVHLPTLRALAYARASRPSVLEAVTVMVDPQETADLQRAWAERQLPVPLKALDSPYREITRPVVEYVSSIRRSSPRDLVVVYVPEYVVGHWWEQLLHNQSALRLKGRLHFTPGVVVASVPYQLHSSQGREGFLDVEAPGRLRRGPSRDEAPATTDREGPGDATGSSGQERVSR